MAGEHLKRRLIKTNRVQLIHALHRMRHSLPRQADLNGWCEAVEPAFLAIGFPTYCHTSPQIPLAQHAVKYREQERFRKAEYHCDLQHDIAKINQSTEAPSGVSSDPLFPKATHWLFQNLGSLKAISIPQLDRVFSAVSNVELQGQWMLSPDGHKCLSTPELVIERYLCRHLIVHAKERDLDPATHRPLTEYPYSAEHNRNSRRQADWVLWRGTQRVFAEYFEGRLTPAYLEGVEAKRRICALNDIQLIEVWRKDLETDAWQDMFKCFTDSERKPEPS